MTNPDNVGGLPSANNPALLPGVHRLWDSQWCNIVNHDDCYRDYSKEEAVAMAVRLTEKKMAENAELCRAAPAGADWRTAPYAATDDAIRKDSGMTLHDRVEYALREAGFDHGEASRIASMTARAGGDDVYGWVLTGPEGSMFCPATHRHVMEASLKVDGCSAVAVYTRPLDSAPAGSGEVDELAKGIEGARDYATGGCVRPDDGDDDQKQWDVLTKAAALLRKLQQGADTWIAPKRASEAMIDCMVLQYDGGSGPARWMMQQLYQAARRAASQGQEGGTNG